MSVLSFRKKPATTPGAEATRDFLRGYSIEVMPRTASKIEDFSTLLPAGTRVYIAHIDGTPFEDMLGTAKRLREDGFAVMPHLPARIIKDRATFDTWLKRYAEEAGIDQALVLAGGPSQPLGDFSSSMELLETGLFDKYGFGTLHVAGHPEGNRDIDPDGTTKLVDEAARWKQAFAERTGAKMAMATQFAFASEPVLDWAHRLHAAGVDLPIHVGVAGPTKLQTLIKFSLACGVGASMSVLKKRAADLTTLLLPFEPTDLLDELSEAWAAGKAAGIEGVHIFPLGGIKAAAGYANGLIADPDSPA